MLEDMRGLLQAADEKRQASIAELSAKHQKVNLHKDGLDVVSFSNNMSFCVFPLLHVYSMLCSSFRTVSVFLRIWRVWKPNLLMLYLTETKPLKLSLHYR